MTIIVASLAVDRSRTAENLDKLKWCPECDAPLEEGWWTLGDGSLSVFKRCDPCEQRFCCIIYNYKEAEQTTFE